MRDAGETERVPPSDSRKQPQLRVRVALILLVGLTLVTLGVVGFRALSGLSYEEEAVVRARATAEISKLEDLFRFEARRIVGAGLSAVENAGAAGPWQFRCLYVGANCPSDPDDLVAFAAIFGDDTQLLLPPDDDFSGPIIEIEFWNRNGGILRKIAGDLTEAASFASDGNGANSPSPEDGLVRTRDGLAACRKTQVAVLDDQVGTVSCTVLSVSVFETVIEKRLHSLYQPEAKRLVLEIRRGDQSQVWAAREQDDAGGFIASKTMAAPFNTYQVIAFEENGKIDELLPFYGLSLFIIVGFVTTVGLATFVHREHVNALKIAEARVNRAAHLSHDLRTPLTNIRLYASMLDPSDNAEDFAKSRNTIVSEVEWLDGLIEHTLAVVRQGTGTSQLSHNADEIVEAACQRFRPLLQNRHSTITTDLDVKRRVRIDRWTLEQVLLNLLDNVRNHAPFSDVYVSTRLIDDRLTLVVQNETQNVSAHPTIELAGGPEQQRHYGMGLKICREIIESDGGEFLSEEQSGRFRAVAVFKVKDAVRRR